MSPEPRLYIECKDCGAWVVDDAVSSRVRVFMRLHYWIDIDPNHVGPRSESDNARMCCP